MSIKEQDIEFINLLGGPTKVSELCSDCSPQAVSLWKSNGIPAGRRDYLRHLKPTEYAKAYKSAA